MTWLALSLYLLGVIGAAAAVGRDVPSGLREWAVVVVWPLVVAVAIAMVLISSVLRLVRP